GQPGQAEREIGQLARHAETRAERRARKQDDHRLQREGHGRERHRDADLCGDDRQHRREHDHDAAEGGGEVGARGDSLQERAVVERLHPGVHGWKFYRMRIALTIAGSDSGGGAGIQAHLRTFAGHGVYGTSAVTAVTAQNTRGVTAWEPVSTELVIAQMEAVGADLPPAAVKTGMLATAAIVEAVAATNPEVEVPDLVVDPVMVAKGGHRLLHEDAAASIRTELLRLAEVVTPNVPEAEWLAGRAIGSIADMRDAGRRIRELGARVVVVKGGHLETGPEVVDVVCSRDGEFEIRGPRIDTPHTHGTGCTFAAAIAARLARGEALEQAIRGARGYLEGAMRHAPGLGSGHGPLGHFWTGILK